jgi:hypothetical protein
MLSESEINERIENLAQNLRVKGLAWSDSQARERAREIVTNELRAQEQFERMKDDPSLNPQQKGHKSQIPPEVLKQMSGGMLVGDELPQDVPLSELLKGTRGKELKK